MESHRELYNAAVRERRDGWSHSKTRIRYGGQSAQLSEIREARPDQAVWSFSSRQATLRRLNNAFAGFLRRVKTAKPGVGPGYPRFKGKPRFDSVEWPNDGDGARWLPDSRRVYLQGVGQVKVHVHRPVTGRVKTIQPNGAAAKRGLSRSISDAGWGRFVSVLRAKAEDAGRIWIEVDPRHTSDRCENCGHAAPENRVSQAAFECQRCSHRAQADEHAARNLLRAGLALHAQVA